MNNFLKLLLLYALISISSIMAQRSIKDTVMLDEITITGTKNSVSRNNVPLSVSIITQKQIEESSESALLPVLSQQVPGVFVTQRGITGFGVSTGAAGSISIRGIGGNPNTQTLVLLNGNPQFMGIMGHPLPDAYVASDVEKVEVIRGPASTLYGSNAMGGVINIITKQQREEGFSINAHTMVGSYSTQKYMLNGGYKVNNVSIFASFNRDKTNGHRPSSDFAINNGYAKIDYDINSNMNLNIDYSVAKFKATDPGPENGAVGYGTDITRGMGAVAFENNFEKTNGSFRFFYNYGEHNITDGFYSKDKNYGVIAYQSFKPYEGTALTAGFDYKNYGGISENLKAMNGKGMVFGDETVYEYAGYGYIQQTFFDRLIANAGFRLEHNQMYGNEAVPSGGLAYHIGNATTIKASVSKGFRSPTIRELYLFAPANKDLQPERMVNYDLGIIHKFFNDRASIEITGYKVKGDNMILTVMGPAGPKNVNSGSFSNIGIEFAGSCRPVNNLDFRVNYSGISMDSPILATPKHQLFISSTYRFSSISINLSLQHINNLYTLVSPSAVTETYTLLNSRIAYRLNGYIDMFIKLENITDEKYYINYAYPMPGRVVFAGLNLHY
jgi:iron complex outermembrane receptor protein